MGMVVLCTTDNNGKKHVITLTHVNYIPNLPVNLLSTWVLSKQYVDENGFDKQGTGVWSAYDTHVLIWDHGRYSKTFMTHSSGLPECLFNSSYSHLNTFTTFLTQKSLRDTYMNPMILIRWSADAPTTILMRNKLHKMHASQENGLRKAQLQWSTTVLWQIWV